MTLDPRPFGPRAALLLNAAEVSPVVSPSTSAIMAATLWDAERVRLVIASRRLDSRHEGTEPTQAPARRQLIHHLV
jgi:hypothetical protein